MSHVDGKSLKPGSQVEVELNHKLTGYKEPQGRLYLAGTDTPIRFNDDDYLVEAYGYNPAKPSQTPVQFWGDAYIKPDRQTRRPPTPWSKLKELVNREVFLRRWDGRRLPATLHQARTGKKVPKFISPDYHRHLNHSYEIIWAITEAFRDLAHQKGLAPSQLRLTPKAEETIYTAACGITGLLQDDRSGLYRSLEFIGRVRDLELKGFAPHHRLFPKNVESLLSVMFEMIVAQFLLAEHGYTDIRQGFKAPFLVQEDDDPNTQESDDPKKSGKRREVDVYARDSVGNGVRVIVGSCKARLTPVPNPIVIKEINQLIAEVALAKKHEQAQGEMSGKQVVVRGVLFTNADRVDKDADSHARKHDISILRVALTGDWAMNPARQRIHPQRVTELGGRSPHAVMPKFRF
jgi:hypothetical protein